MHVCTILGLSSHGQQETFFASEWASGDTVAALKIWSVSTLTLFFDDLSVAADEMTAVCDVTWKQSLMDEQDQKKRLLTPKASLSSCSYHFSKEFAFYVKRNFINHSQSFLGPLHFVSTLHSAPRAVSTAKTSNRGYKFGKTEIWICSGSVPLLKPKKLKYIQHKVLKAMCSRAEKYSYKS